MIFQIYQKDIKIGVNPKSIRHYFDEIDIFDKQIKSLADYQSKSFVVLNTQSMNSLLALDSNQKEANEEVKKNILADPELEEAFFILQDLINYSNNISK